jgi:hypothetical protein
MVPLCQGNSTKSVCFRHVNQPQAYQKQKEQQLVFAMKCLRPQARFGHEQFMIGVDDLLKETTMLASIDQFMAEEPETNTIVSPMVSSFFWID